MPTQKPTFSPPKQCGSQLTVHWSQPSFTFSAKERDAETGLSVTSLREVSSLRLGKVRTSSLCTRSLRRFGSRYYSSDLSIWLSVDPMASKYPGLSPFTYCADNPMKLVDPNGEEITKFEDANGNLIKQINDGSNAVFRQVGTGQGLHYEFSGYDESQGGINEVNLSTPIQEQQQLNSKNPKLQQSDSGTTYCNIATQNVMSTVASVPGNENALVTGNANTMCDKMGKSTNYVAVSKSEAINYGKKGLAVVAYKNPNGGHGHVATFSAGNNPGEVANIGPKGYTGFINVNKAISSKKPKSFFIFVSGYVLETVIVK